MTILLILNGLLAFGNRILAGQNNPVLHVTVIGQHANSIHVVSYLQSFEQTDFHFKDAVVYCTDNEATWVSPFSNVPSHVILILIIDSLNRQPALYDFLVTPGDNVAVVYDNDKKFHFSGMGCEKYSAQYNMQEIASYSKIQVQPVSNKPFDIVTYYSKVYDSIYQVKMQALKNYQAKLPKSVYDALACDCLVSCYAEQIHIVNANLDDEHLDSQFDEIKDFYQRTLSGIGDELVNEPAILLAHYAPELYLQKELISIKIRNYTNRLQPTHKYPGYEMITRLKTKYRGVLRDNLLTQFLVSRNNDYDSMALFSKKSMPYILDPEHRKVITQLERKCKGSPLFDFILTDTLGQTVRPSMFTGKVLLMDFWFNGCVGCKAVTPAMGKLMDYFHHDSSIVLLSISIDRTKARWFRHINDFVAPGALMVTTGAMGEQDPLIKYYDIYGYPTLIVVDKKGKIISFDPDHYSNKAMFNTVRKLIIDALKQS